MADKKKKRVIITAQRVDEEALVAGMESQGNVIPVAIATVLRIVAPIIARIAIRFVARKLHRTVSEATVRTAGALVGNLIQRIIAQAAKEGS